MIKEFLTGAVIGFPIGMAFMAFLLAWRRP
jgi:hypothetical protein